MRSLADRWSLTQNFLVVNICNTSSRLGQAVFVRGRNYSVTGGQGLSLRAFLVGWASRPSIRMTGKMKLSQNSFLSRDWEMDLL